MYRPIRIDDDVHALLEARRRHRGETCNQVLRRLAGLEPDHPGDPEPGNVGPTLTVTQRAVWDVLATGVTMTAAQITAAAAISPAATGKALRHLEQAGKARRHRIPGNATRRWYDEWSLVDVRDNSDGS